MKMKKKISMIVLVTFLLTALLPTRNRSKAK